MSNCLKNKTDLDTNAYYKVNSQYNRVPIGKKKGCFSQAHNITVISLTYAYHKTRRTKIHFSRTTPFCWSEHTGPAGPFSHW